MNHNTLLYKLHDYGIRGVALVKNHLCIRKQCVKVADLTSPTTMMTNGVPQRSILAPLLFILYINDLCDVSNLPKVVMYTDDANIFFAAQILSHLNTTTNNYLIKLEQWLNTNGLILNISKTKYIISKPQNKQCDAELPLNFQETALKRVASENVLGVLFAETMSCNAHDNKFTIE